MHVMHYTKPDIAYVVGVLSRYTHNPGYWQWKSIDRIFRYTKKTTNYGLCYKKQHDVSEGYTNASWIFNSDNLISGWIFTIGGIAVSWGSKKQICIAHSIMESEFIALAVAGKEAKWIKNFMKYHYVLN